MSVNFDQYDFDMNNGPKQEFSMEDRLKKLAFHEAGHLVMSALLTQLSFKLTIDVFFPFPKTIWINGEKDKGCVEGGGLPIYSKWSDSQSGKDLIDSFFSYPKPYTLNKKLAVANVLLCMAGFAADLTFVNRERQAYINFGGGDRGEANDRKNADGLFGLLLPKNEYPNQWEKDDAITKLIIDLFRDLKELFEMDSVRKAIHKVADRVKTIPVSDSDRKEIAGKEFQGLFREIREDLRKVEVDHILEKYAKRAYT